MQPAAEDPFSSRLAKVRRVMAEAGVDLLLVAPSSDLLYLIGQRLEPMPRLAVLVVPREGPATYVLPRLEAVGLRGLPSFVAVRPWREGDSPLRLAAEAVGDAGAAEGTIAVSDRMWSVFLLGFQEQLPRARFVPALPVLRLVRMVKSAGELEALAAAGRAVDWVFARICEMGLEARSEKEVAARIEAWLREVGHKKVNFVIVAAGESGAEPHHEPDERAIRAGDALMLDFGGTYRDYCSDITRTVCVGKPDRELAQVHEVVRRAQEAGVRAVAPGIACAQVDAAARTIISEAGYGEYFIHRTGHGIGLDVHEDPYLYPNSEVVLVEGMAVTVEPGIYLPGRFGVRIEDVVVVSATGAYSLSSSPRELLVLS